ncbi:hypothetical protein GUY44_23800 [Pimelobacter simplex]|uniref:hypothetical protein n=1 Tax=Nocardioides simplex TaxID=2045 RepID=UPI0008DEAEB5|nr:hypothetical protein [Pimelobacter simplex]MCG8153524.1 hypothetical protein [Pimelobacter simplex]GEB15810.1 hypothetical protein NSI01_41250 [Pimelobacter simplex]SFN11198.1 hypothetical protein SAMN05421671_5217 [Pimelobacter simplex]
MEQSRRYGRWIALAVVAVTAALVGFAIASAKGGAEGRAPDVAPTPAASTTAPARQPGPDLGTPLADCPEVMRFFERPEVRAVQERLGRAPLPSDGFVGGCPNVKALEEAFRRAQDRTGAGATPGAP